MHQFLLPLGKWVAASDFPTPGESRYYEKNEGFYTQKQKLHLNVNNPGFTQG